MTTSYQWGVCPLTAMCTLYKQDMRTLFDFCNMVSQKVDVRQWGTNVLHKFQCYFARLTKVDGEPGDSTFFHGSEANIFFDDV